MAQPTRKPGTGDMVTRIASAAVLAPMALGATWAGPPFFDALVGIGALVLAWEWSRACGGRPAWLVAGFFYIAIPCAALVMLRGEPEAGRATIFWLFAVVWSADSGAYLIGTLVGGPKMAPTISPGKTWSGLLGGIALAGLAGMGTAAIMDTGPFALALLSAVIGAVSQAGDLAESWAKRRFGVKDMGRTVPGHGGLFDRVDGLLAATLPVAALAAIEKGGILAWT